MTTYQLFLALTLFAMALLSFFVLILLGLSRFKAARAKKLDAHFYKLYRGDGEPDEIRQISRNFQNLCEAPVLFYVAVLAALALNIQSMLMLYLAWAYVILRCVHSYIHCTSNRVKLRFRTYILSFVVLIVIWLSLLINLVRFTQ